MGDTTYIFTHKGIWAIKTQILSTHDNPQTSGLSP